jgi:hypothetical protein
VGYHEATGKVIINIDADQSVDDVTVSVLSELDVLCSQVK